MRGTIIKGIAGFYYVKTKERIFQCKARGIFKKDGRIPYVGDEAVIEETDSQVGEGIITELLPRKNSFLRPPIANVDCLVVVMALADPKPNLMLLDKFLVMAEKAHAEVVLCFNKQDLDQGELLSYMMEIYGALYPVVTVSGKSGDGISQLKLLLKGKKSALAGPSGVGKSTILNLLCGNDSAETGEISRKSKRGKHTTKHVEIFELKFGGMLYDTPGFTSFDVLEAEEEELALLYPEMGPFIGQCKYHNCRHMKEPGCCVRAAVEMGKIHDSRYKSYVALCEEIREKRKNLYG